MDAPDLTDLTDIYKTNYKVAYKIAYDRLLEEDIGTYYANLYAGWEADDVALASVAAVCDSLPLKRSLTF